MEITYPHIIENCVGEKLLFKELQKEPDGDRLIVENYVTPGHYDQPQIPQFVKKIIIPLTYYIGKLLGKYKHFEEAPEPVQG